MEELLSIKQAAEMLGVSRTKIYALIVDGQLHPQPIHPLYKKHSRVGISRAEVEALLPRPQG